ncbi:MAG: hypothetical protein WEB06_16910 [Actinomycetota bacterium]
MSVPLLVLLLAPLVGAVAAIAFAEVPTQRRALVAVCSAAILGGAATALVRSAASEAVAWRGFASDAWTALLSLGAVASIVAGIARAGGRRRPAPTEAVLFAAAAAGVAPLLVREVHLLAVTLPVSTLAFACAAVVSSRRETLGLAHRRAIAALALSDVAALLAIGTAVSSGTKLPPDLSITAGALLLGAVALRLGLVPLWWGAGDASRADPVIAAIWLGPIRAQGLLLVPAAVAAGRGVAYAAAAAAAATASLFSVRALRNPDLGPAATVGVSLAVLGISLGGPVALWGAILCIAAAFASVPAWFAGRAARESIRPTVGVLPAGAMLPGAVLVVAATFEAAVVRPAFLAFALPALAATLVLAAAVSAGIPGRGLHTRARGDRPAAALWGWLSVAAATALAALPVRAVHGLAFPVSDALGVGRLLRVGAEPGVAEDLAIVMVAVAVLAFLVGPGRAGSGGPPAGSPRTPPRRFALLPARLPLPIAEREWSIAATVLMAASIGIAIRVYIVASGRGFL